MFIVFDHNYINSREELATMSNIKSSNNFNGRLERTSGLPLYLQIKDDLLSKIEAGVWHENDMIPTEEQFCNEYGVSKITIREAIKILVQDGLLYRRPGKGTFLAKPKLEQQLNRVFGFNRWAEQHGLEPSCRVLKVEVQDADKYTSQHLDLSEGDQITRIEHLCLGNNEPLMLEYLSVPVNTCPDLHLQDLSSMPLNQIIVNSYQIPLMKVRETIEPEFADDYLSKMLTMNKESLLLVVEHTTYTQFDKAIYFGQSYYRGDRYKFFTEIQSDQ